MYMQNAYDMWEKSNMTAGWSLHAIGFIIQLAPVTSGFSSHIVKCQIGHVRTSKSLTKLGSLPIVSCFAQIEKFVHLHTSWKTVVHYLEWTKVSKPTKLVHDAQNTLLESEQLINKLTFVQGFLSILNKLLI